MCVPYIEHKEIYYKKLIGDKDSLNTEEILPYFIPLNCKLSLPETLLCLSCN